MYTGLIVDHWVSLSIYESVVQSLSWLAKAFVLIVDYLESGRRFPSIRLAVLLVSGCKFAIREGATTVIAMRILMRRDDPELGYHDS